MGRLTGGRRSHRGNDVEFTTPRSASVVSGQRHHRLRRLRHRRRPRRRPRRRSRPDPPGGSRSSTTTRRTSRTSAGCSERPVRAPRRRLWNAKTVKELSVGRGREVPLLLPVGGWCGRSPVRSPRLSAWSILLPPTLLLSSDAPRRSPASSCRKNGEQGFRRSLRAVLRFAVQHQLVSCPSVKLSGWPS